MFRNEPVMFHKAYPLEPFLEESRIMEKERELMLSYLPEQYQKMQRKVEETCDRMEYEGSRMYDEHPDGTVIRQMARKIMEELTETTKTHQIEGQKAERGKDNAWNCMDGGCQTDRYQEDMVCCFLCNEMLRRRYRMWRSKRYTR